MKFLLVAVNAKYIHSSPAVYSLRAFAGENAAKHVEIAEYTVNRRPEFILSDIYRRRPDVLAFSCYIWNWEIIRRLLCDLPKLLPGMPVWLGGPEVTFGAAQILGEYQAVSGIMTGEGEETFSELLQYYLEARHTGKGESELPDTDGEKRRSPDGIRGIVFRNESGIVYTGEREAVNPDSLPFLYDNPDYFKNRIVYYETSRGCPYGCSYCLSSIDRSVRFRDLGTVKRELGLFLSRRVPQVKLMDRTFNSDRGRTGEIWSYLLEHDNGVTNFHFEIAGDILAEEELALLAAMRPGLVQLEIGVQSDNPRTLREIHRVTDREKLHENVERIIAGKNVHVHLDLIAGLPFEDYGSFGHSFDYVYRMHPHQLQLGFLKVLKGSPMYEKAGEYGINYTAAPPYEVLYSKWLAYDDLCRLKRVEEMVELYYNSGQFTHTLPVLESAFESPFSMYESLAAFYEEKGFLTDSPSRLYRYDILLAFARAHDGEREELYRELLLFDLYLRENLKSRPGFASDSRLTGKAGNRDGTSEEIDLKKRIRSFYQKEEKERMLLPDYAAVPAGQLARMTHVEPFRYSVWLPGGEARTIAAGEGAAVLFDYQTRNPLTKEARAVPIFL